MTNKTSKEEYRRNLPHIQPPDALYFITFRLYGSVPLEKLEFLNNLYLNTNTTDMCGKPIKQLKQAQKEDFFLAFDEFLDTNPNGPYYLANPEIAALVCNSIKYRDGKDYKLVCFCIMSNHVHLIIYKLAKPLHIIMKELKSFTGKEALKYLRESEWHRWDNAAPAAFNSSEQALRVPIQQAARVPELRVSLKFWQPESFDRIVRDRNDMSEKIKYTLSNPVKAGLVSVWNKWEWSYCRPEFLD